MRYDPQVILNDVEAKQVHMARSRLRRKGEAVIAGGQPRRGAIEDTIFVVLYKTVFVHYDKRAFFLQP